MQPIAIPYVAGIRECGCRQFQLIRGEPMPTSTHAFSDSTRRPRRHIGLLLFDGVEELDAVGPWDVLAYWTQQYPDDGWSVSCISADGGEVIAAKGLVIGAHYATAQAPELDVFI